MTENPLIAVAAQMENLAAENESLRESLEDVKRSLAFEDRGWRLIGGVLGGDHTEGLRLEDVREISETIRPYVIGGSLVQRASNLRRGYVWSKGFHIDVPPRDPSRTGRPPREVRFMENQRNVDCLFSASAHSLLERAAFTDGNLIALCFTALDEVRTFPLSQVTAIRFNPDFPDEVWAVQRTWPGDDPAQPSVMWYYTNKFTGRRAASIEEGGVRQPVAQDVTAVFRAFNRQTGWPMGVPDATAMLPWYEAYSEIMRYGRVVNEALSKMLYKLVAKTAKSANNAAVKVADSTVHGGTAALVEGMDLQALSTAGKGYDFTSARPVAAMMAAAVDVPNIELLADSSAAGSSYGAAQSLTPSTINAMRFRQDEWIEFYAEIFRVFGMTPPKMWFDPIEEPDPYREAQRAMILWGSGLIHPDEMRGLALDILDIPALRTNPPQGVLTPNNAASLARRDLDTDTPVQAASPDQGQGNGTGGMVSNNDMRSDVLSNSLIANAMLEERISELREIVLQFRNAQNS